MFKKFTNLFSSDNDDNEKSSEENDMIEDNFFDDEDSDDDDDYEDDEDDEDDDYDDDDDDYEIPEEEIGQQASMPLDPNTLHGLHYTEDEFNAEVEKRVLAFQKEEEADGEVFEQEDIDNLYFNFRREVYQEWTGANSNMMLQWEQINQQKMTGMASYGFTKHDDNNPLLAPIHGISLEDYAAAAYFLGTGTDVATIIEKLGIENTAWDEVQTLWGKRMEEDTTFAVATLFSQYYGTAENHPKLSGAATPVSAAGEASIAKMKNDRSILIEAQAAVAAAYEYGIDGAQWLQDNYEISNAELQKVAAYYGDLDAKNIDMDAVNKNANYFTKKMEEYKKKFAEEQGGNVADDIDF